ncbi:MAG: 50S ribosomal protein L5 [Patescibacteria group bacterium]|nr:50S ribosomal protein L5 [Patescibacteria group bacterium]
MLSFREKYIKEVVPALSREFSVPNVFMLPRVVKVTVNMGIGRIFKDDKLVDEAREILRRVTGQQPAVRTARTAIAGFKTRIGSPVGLKVTLRGKRMHDFLDRLIHVALARTRDFRGIALRAVDANGNLTIGIKEHIIFPETTEFATRQMYGMEVTVTTTGHDRVFRIAMLRAMGFPLQAQ